MANSDKESKLQVEYCEDCIIVKNKNMRRGKPHQQIYRPGSGPLKKSVQGAEDTNFDLNSKQNHMNDSTPFPKYNRRKNENVSYRNNGTETEGDLNHGRIGFENKKRNKKPEKPIYVPKPLAQAMAVRENNQSTSSNDKGISNKGQNVGIVNNEGEYRNHKKIDQRNGNVYYNGSSEKLNVNCSKSKRFPPNRRQNIEHSEQQVDSDNRYLAPTGDRRYVGNRDSRQASEPRVVAPPSNINRVRDTRSVEPSGNNTLNHNHQGEKLQSKPPSGRRHSTICLETNKPHKPMQNIDSLPPRFRRKLLAENQSAANYSGVLEETWNGSSVTFQGSDMSHYSLPNVYPNTTSYQQVDCRPNYPYSFTNCATLPHTKMRGRGRLRPEYVDGGQYGNQMLRSLTPDGIMLSSPCNSRPCTPPFAQKNKSVENISYFDNRCRTPQTTLNTGTNSDVSGAAPTSPINQTSAPSNFEVHLEPPTSSSPAKNNNTVREEAEESFDWSEEVELNERLEAEALSDSMTRCSSVASLVENVPQQPPTNKSRRSKKYKGRRNRSSSRHSKRDKSADNQIKSNTNNDTENNQSKHNKRNKQNGKESSHREKEKEKQVDNDGFKVPETRHKRRKNSFRDKSSERRKDRRSHNDSRHSSLDRGRRDSYNEREDWREEIRLRCSSERKLESGNTDKKAEHGNVEKREVTERNKTQAPGIIVLPQSTVDRSKPPILHIPDTVTNRQVYRAKSSPSQQRTLYDHNNPNKPIIVTTTNSRAGDPVQSEQYNLETGAVVLHTTDQFGNVRPVWYDSYSENFRSSHCSDHLLDVRRADLELQFIINNGALIHNWNSSVAVLRKFFRESLEYLLVKDIKFCQTENVEHHYWKILYYNIIEIMRKSITVNPENKEQYKNIILSLIEEGTKYFERLLEVLEETYKFKLDNYLGNNNMPPGKGLRFVGLALVSAQKIFLFLGDLARYKEQLNESLNYGKCKQWYIKAHEINPKNGRPYNQLALLAVYTRRKIDAVYYYMRSLMSSNPVQSAKESLISIFDENRKKYEQSERKRREEKAKLQMKEKESSRGASGSLRREIWVHPEGGRRLHRTTSTAQETVLDSEEEDLHSLTSVQVNKRFIISYLHVHGKLITKIGMETFQQAALQMLREFRVLLQQSPVPLQGNRILQLLALNMFAIDSTQLKGPELEPRCRSEVQERALIVSLQMFNIILERCVELLQEHLRQQDRNGGKIIQLCPDLQVILPAVKVWCDWMLCHSPVWNPPPSCSDYRVGHSADTWIRLAALMNLLEKLEYQKLDLESHPEGKEMVRLPEDASMAGFTPLMHNTQEAVYVREEVDREAAQMCLRINKILFFGTVFLCGLEPPVLKLQKYDCYSEYVSVVRTSSRDSPPSPPELCNEDLLVESFSEDEDDGRIIFPPPDATPGEVRSLLDRKVELERRQRTQELHRQHVQAILQQSVVSVEMEVRPRYLVPDTNCFIDYLDRLRAIAQMHGPHLYTLMVPLVVLGELEGLARGGKAPAPAPRVSLDPQHMLKVADAARNALEFLRCRNPAIKCLTTRGTVLASSTFTSEDEDKSHEVGPRNDDRILATCVSLCRSSSAREQQQQRSVSPAPSQRREQTGTDNEQSRPAEPRKIYREVVLLTEDRNLRVKALGRDVPVRELPDFLQWAGLG